MAERGEGGGSKHGKGLISASAVDTSGGRLRFTVELHPEETTIVSWAKLLIEANVCDSNRPESSTCPSVEAHPSFVSQPPPPLPAAPYSKKHTENKLKYSMAQEGSNRLSTVIEGIDRIHEGNESSFEEDLNIDNVLDDDDYDYDTEDYFIDDTELDDYFQDDNSAIKHDGFFVNHGKSECTFSCNDPTISTDQQPKKRGHEDLIKASGSDDGHTPQKIMKKEHKGTRISSMIQRSSASQSHEEATPNVHMLVQDPPSNAAEASLKRTADIQVDPSALQNDENELQDTSNQRPCDGKSHRKEGSSVGAEGIMLVKALSELEKIVAAFGPPPTEAPHPDSASPAVKRKLRLDIRLKIAEIAGIERARCGKVPKDTIDHLMSIVGHMIRIGPLKIHLKAIAKMGLSAKQEKDDLMQKIKDEVGEMVKSRILRIKFKEVAREESLIRKSSMDDVLENEICDI